MKGSAKYVKNFFALPPVWIAAGFARKLTSQITEFEFESSVSLHTLWQFKEWVMQKKWVITYAPFCIYKRTGRPRTTSAPARAVTTSDEHFHSNSGVAYHSHSSFHLNLAVVCIKLPVFKCQDKNFLTSPYFFSKCPSPPLFRCSLSKTRGLSICPRGIWRENKAFIFVF
jgi:hypothetical protein